MKPCILAGFLLCLSSFAEAAPERANVLMIIVDDLNDWIGCLDGQPSAKTPHIDRLAAMGTVFTNAHTQAPLCNPSRTSALSGLRPSTTGVYGLAPGPRAVPMLGDWVMLPQYFQRNGYFTASFGKVYHDGAIKTPSGQAREWTVWGPAPGEPLPPKKFVETPLPMKVVDWGEYNVGEQEYYHAQRRQPYRAFGALALHPLCRWLRGTLRHGQ